MRQQYTKITLSVPLWWKEKLLELAYRDGGRSPSSLLQSLTSATIVAPEKTEIPAPKPKSLSSATVVEPKKILHWSEDPNYKHDFSKLPAAAGPEPIYEPEDLDPNDPKYRDLPPDLDALFSRPTQE